MQLPMTTPAHVLLTTDAVGGVWTHALDLARGLVAGGTTVTLAVLGPAPDAAQTAEAALPGIHLCTTGLQLDWLAETPAEVEATAATLATLTREVGADLIHLHAAPLALARFPTPVIVHCHSCVATWWDAVRPHDPRPADFAWRHDVTARGLAAADLAIAPSAAFAAATARAYGLARPPLVVLNGRAAPVPCPHGPSAPVTFTAGRLWDPGKNIVTLDRAAALARASVVAAGAVSGPEGSHIALAHIRPLGRLDAAGMAAWLATDLACYVSVALYEPFGLAVLEAAQHGHALVLSDIPSFRELWDGAATFVPPEDATALVTALDRMAGNPAHRSALGAAARQRAARYTDAAMVAATLAAYRAVLPMRRGVAA